MRLTTLFVALGILFIAACDEEDQAKPSGAGGASGRKLPEASEALKGEEFPEKRLPSERRLRGVLVAKAGGLNRWQPATSRTNPGTKKVRAKAEYISGEYNYDAAVTVSIEWFGKPIMGSERFGFGIYKPKKAKIASLDALWHGADEMADTNQVHILVVPQLQIRAQSKKTGVEQMKKILGDLDLAGLKKQAEDGSLFTPSAEDRIAESLLDLPALRALLPKEIAGFAAQGEGTGQRLVKGDKPMTHIATGYGPIGHVTLFDLGTAEKAKERYPLRPEEFQGYEMYQKDPNTTLKPEMITVAGHPACVVLISRKSSTSTTTIMLRARVGRYVIQANGIHNNRKPPRGMDAEAAKKQGIGVFKTPMDHARAIISAFDL